MACHRSMARLFRSARVRSGSMLLAAMAGATAPFPKLPPATPPSKRATLSRKSQACSAASPRSIDSSSRASAPCK